MIRQPILTTARLTLRPFEVADAERVAALLGNFEVVRTTQNIPYPYTLDIAVSWIASHERALRENSRVAYAILLADQQLLVGTVSLINIQDSQASLGYWIGQPYWGQGICTEAVATILAFAFQNLGLKRVYADHYLHNPASGKVMLKNAMLPVGQRDGIDRNGEKVRIRRYEIFSS